MPSSAAVTPVMNQIQLFHVNGGSRIAHGMRLETMVLAASPRFLMASSWKPDVPCPCIEKSARLPIMHGASEAVDHKGCPARAISPGHP